MLKLVFLEHPYNCWALLLEHIALGKLHVIILSQLKPNHVHFYLRLPQMQYQCGCSYAFSAMGALEGATALAKGTFTALSEQNIVDCSGKSTYNIVCRIIYSLTSMLISDWSKFL